MERLAVIEADPGTLRRAIERAALYAEDGTSDPHEEMFLRVGADGVETPASAPGASQATYCTLAADRLEGLSVEADPPVDALFDVTTVRGWLAWLNADTVAVEFHGEVGIASRVVLAGGEATVEFACENDPGVLEAVETYLPERFDGSTFLDDDGNPMPTRIETTAGTLSRLVSAVDHATESDRYPVVVRDGRLMVDVIGERGTVDAELAAEVAGPAVTNHYGHGFARIVHGLDGPVTLQTGPSESVAFVQAGDGFVRRFVVAHA